MKQYLATSYNRLRATRFLSNFFNLSGIQLSNILLTLLIFPIITRKIGLQSFGYVTLANTFSVLTGTLINFGTNETGIRDVASNTQKPEKLSNIVYSVFWVRIFFFICYLFALLAFQSFYDRYHLFILMSIPIVAAEVFNPLFFYIGIEKLKIFNIANLLSNILSVVCVLLFIKGPQNAHWVNFILGSSSVLAYMFLSVRAILNYELRYAAPDLAGLITIAKHNVYLTANSVSVQLQQSIMIFALGSLGNTVLLGAYAICDKVIRSTRTMSITLSTALYPMSAKIFSQDPFLWNNQRKKWKLIITCLFFAGSILIFVFAGFIIHLLSKERNDTAVIFLRIMAMVPTVSAINSLNVIDQLIKKQTVNIFKIAVILLVLSLLLAFMLIKSGNYLIFGAFTLVIETCAWLMYEFVVKRTAQKYA